MSIKSRIKGAAFVAASAMTITMLAGCSAGGSGANAAAAAVDPAIQSKVDKCLSDVAQKVYNKGPQGETATPASQLTLTQEEIDKVRAMKKTVAIAWHVFGSDYSTAQVAALKDTFNKLGIEILTTTDGQFQVNKQTNDIQTILARKPDFMVSLPVDAPSETGIYQQAAAAGVKLVFALNAPPEMKAGKDYLTVVGSDDYGTGVVSACQLVKAVNGKGKVGILYHAAHYYATQQRLDAVHQVLKEYPGIQIVEEKGSPGPDFTGQGAAATNSMLSQHPDLNGMWAVWDTHAEGVIAAARERGKNGSNFAITTIDLGKTVAVSTARNDLVKGVGGSQPYNQGVAEAMAVAYSLLGKDLAPYYAWNALPVDSSNVADQWKKVYNADAPKEIADAANKK
jgi:ribose transport system substrate-binding protein